MKTWGTLTDSGTIVPYGRWRGPVLDHFKVGERLAITIEKDRNGKFNSLLHLCLDLIAKAVNRGPATTDKDQLKKWIKLKKGWFDVLPLPHPKDGITHVIDYHSTSFASMGEDEFRRFAMDACELIAAELAPWIEGAPEYEEAMAIINQIRPEK